MRRRAVLAGGLWGSVAWAGGAGARRAGLRPVAVTVQGWASLKQLPLWLALRLGYFADEGLDVTFQSVPPHVQRLEQLAQLPLELFAGTFERTLYLNAQGAAHQALVLLARSPQVVLAASARHYPADVGLPDLAGARIGVSASGALGHRVAQLALLRGGLSAHDAHYIELPTPQAALRAFERGDIEVLSHTDPLITRLDVQGWVRLVSDTRTLRECDQVFGGPMACTCLSAPRDWIERHPQTAQGLANGLVRALKWLHTAAPVDLAPHLPPRLSPKSSSSAPQDDASLFLSAFYRSRETLSMDGRLADAAPLTVMRALDRLKVPLNWARVQPEQTYTHRFVDRAKARYRV